MIAPTAPTSPVSEPRRRSAVDRKTPSTSGPRITLILLGLATIGGVLFFVWLLLRPTGPFLQANAQASPADQINPPAATQQARPASIPPSRPIPPAVSGQPNGPASEPVTAPALKPGKVRVTVTWQFNNVVGTKPDTGAIVILVPLDLKRKLSGNVLGHALLPLPEMFDREEKELRKSGAFAALTGGDGKALLSKIPPGKYRCIIVSKSTTDDPEMSKLVTQGLERFFDEVNIGTKKVFQKEVEVESAEEVELTHDFGNTYF